MELMGRPQPANQKPIFDSRAKKLWKKCCKRFQKNIYFTYFCEFAKKFCS